MMCRCQLLSIAPLRVAHTKTSEKTDGILSKERFRLFPQRYFFRNTAALLYFMLHRLLSVTSVKNMCCHIAIPHTLRDELTCARFQLYIWRLNLLDALSLVSPLENKFSINVDRIYHHSVRT